MVGRKCVIAAPRKGAWISPVLPICFCIVPWMHGCAVRCAACAFAATPRTVWSLPKRSEGAAGDEEAQSAAPRVRARTASGENADRVLPGRQSNGPVADCEIYVLWLYLPAGCKAPDKYGRIT